MAYKQIIEKFVFDENYIKELLVDIYVGFNENDAQWKIEIDYSKTPALISIVKNTTEIIRQDIERSKKIK